MDKRIVLYLIDLRNDHGATHGDTEFVIEKMKNTSRYVAGTPITKRDVDAEIKKAWVDVNIRKPLRKDYDNGTL